jgi:hypothetical protein
MGSNEQARNEAQQFGLVLREASELLDAMLAEKKPKELAEELALYERAFRMLQPVAGTLDDRPKCLAVLKLAEAAVCSGDSYQEIFQVERLADTLLGIIDRSPGIPLGAKARVQALRTAILRVQEWVTKGYTGCLVHWKAGVVGSGEYHRSFEPVSDRSKKNRQALAMGSNLVLEIADQLVREAIGPKDAKSAVSA